MKRFSAVLLLFVQLCVIATAQEMVVIFSANLETSGGVYLGDFSGADLFAVRFDPIIGSVTDLRRLTTTTDVGELFPSLSPTLEWIAFEAHKGNKVELMLMHTESQRITFLMANGRFPEWISPTELLVTQVRGDSNDVYIVTLDVSGPAPTIASSRKITNRQNCPATSMASDAYPFDSGRQLVFHVLRDGFQTGAAMARMNIDGTAYRRLTNWNGSGHGVVTADGKTIVCSSSATGLPVLIDVRADTAISRSLSVPSKGDSLARFDQRYKNFQRGNWAYQAWGANERSLFHCVQTSNQTSGMSRLIYTKFDDQWKNPQYIDFSSAVEALAGKSGRDFSTCSARAIPIPAKKGIVYVCLFMHNEDLHHPKYPDFSKPENKSLYLTSRASLIEFCSMLKRNNLPFNWESDWNFLNGVFLWDTPDVTSGSDGKNVIRYIMENLGTTVDPHSHENDGYNYADVAHLIDSLGVVPTNVVGGHIWDPADSKYQDWERFRSPLAGNKFPWSKWKGDILIGHGTNLHQNDPEPSGVWRPKGKYAFWTDEPANKIYAIGQYKTSMPGLIELVNLYKTGAIPEEKILTSCLFANQWELNAQFTSNYENTFVKTLLEMQARGEIKVVTFGQVIELWKTIYNSEAHLFQGKTTAVENGSHSVASSPSLTLSPNPFSDQLEIHFSLQEDAFVEISICNGVGKEVATVSKETFGRGEQSLTWTQTQLMPGVYFVLLKTNGRLIMNRAVYVR